MPLYGFKCSQCNRNWEAYRTPGHLYSEYCCGVESRLEGNIEPKSMALETFEDGPALQLHGYTDSNQS